MPDAKPKRRTVTDDEFETARANRDNRLVVAKVLRKYDRYLSRDELEACGLDALWRCLQYHREGFGQKFTTSLHRFAHWECRREARRKKGPASRPLHHSLDSVLEYQFRPRRDSRELSLSDRESYQHALARISALPDEHRDLLRQYYVDGLSFSEIGRLRGYSKETARDRIGSAIEALRLSVPEALPPSAVATEEPEPEAEAEPEPEREPGRVVNWNGDRIRLILDGSRELRRGSVPECSIS